jgi:aspartate/methionine/tyrosine aminotransferase
VGLRRAAAETFCRWAREAAGVLLVPSTLFDHGDRHVRFGLGRAGVPAALAALGDLLAREPDAG